MRKDLILAAVFALLALQTGSPAAPPPAAPQSASRSKAPALNASQPYDDPDAYEVYAALFKESYGRGLAPIAIQSETESRRPLCSDAGSSSDPRFVEAIRDYSRQNGNPRFLKAEALKFGDQVRLISPDELKPIFAKGPIAGWKTFYKTYTGTSGLGTLSAVGFSNDRRFALVYSSGSCGSLCGAGGFTTLTKKNGAWQRTQDHLCEWIS